MEIFTRKGRGRPRKIVVDAKPAHETADGIAANHGFGQTSGCGTTSQTDAERESVRLAEIAAQRKKVRMQAFLLNQGM